MSSNMRTFSGEVISGTGHMSLRMGEGSVALQLYENMTGSRLVPGSLNILLDQEVDMPDYSEEIIRDDHEGHAIVYIVPALLNSHECFVVRNKKVEEGTGRHSKQVIEIISEHKLRDQLQLVDGDQVTVSF